jgi:hypothetical protein
MTNRRYRLKCLLDKVEAGGTADKEILQELLSIITEIIGEFEPVALENRRLKQKNLELMEENLGLEAELIGFQGVTPRRGKLQ